MGGLEYFMNRREAREVLLGLIYEADFAKNGEAALPDTDAIYRLAAQCREIEPDAYVETVFSDIGGHIADIDRRIFLNTNGWKENRLSRVSLSIMRLCVYEMLYRPDVPFSVSINEAVELAKRYDHDKAPRFINGVLNAVAEQEGLKKPKEPVGQ